MTNRKSIRLFVAAAILSALASGSASAAGNFVQIVPNILPKTGVQLNTIPRGQLHYCMKDRIYGKAEYHTANPKTVPDTLPWDLYTASRQDWIEIVAEQIGPDFANADIAMGVRTDMQYDYGLQVWWYNWSARPCR